jgi:hypothetical protein
MNVGAEYGDEPYLPLCLGLAGEKRHTSPFNCGLLARRVRLQLRIQVKRSETLLLFQALVLQSCRTLTYRRGPAAFLR